MSLSINTPPPLPNPYHFSPQNFQQNLSVSIPFSLPNSLSLRPGRNYAVSTDSTLHATLSSSSPNVIMLLTRLFCPFLLMVCGLAAPATVPAPDHQLEAAASKPHKWEVIVRALGQIHNGTIALDNVLKQWDGTIQDALPIYLEKERLLATLSTAESDIVEKSPNLGIISAFKVKDATKRMMGPMRDIVATAIGLHQRFQDAMLAGLVTNIIYDIRESARHLNKVVEKKVPGIGRGEAKKLAKKIDGIFGDALKVYDPHGNSKRDLRE